MQNAQDGRSEKQPQAGDEKNSNLITPPSLSLPKGGGAIRGIGEKFAANPVTGTGSMSVPIATSPGRSGFGPQLTLSYDSGSGNGPFGLGWNLSLASITRKTDKGLPKYQDADEPELDVFILSGAEDLVPVLINSPGGQWAPETVPPRTLDGAIYTIKRYRPRTEGLFARVERWTNQADPQDTFWRSISKDNLTTWYGKTAESRITDASDPPRIFSWLICESYDDKGNAIVYGYKPEDATNLDPAAPFERNRLSADNFPQRYLKYVRYGNRTPRLAEEDLTLRNDWLFEVVFDYGEHDPATPTTKELSIWPVRQDSFSLFRATFEVRTYRLCRRILMFHHFPDELGGVVDYLVQSTDFEYMEGTAASFVSSVTHTGYVRQSDGNYLKKSLPKLEFKYTAAQVDETVHEIDPESTRHLPVGVDGNRYQWVDLDSEGLTGVLTEQADAWYYKRNLGNGTFGPGELVVPRPSPAALSGGQQQLLDLAGEGQLELVQFDGPIAGFHTRTPAGGWEPFTRFRSMPHVNIKDANLRFLDITGDGHADILVSEETVFTWYESNAKEGFGPARHSLKSWDEEKGPKLIFSEPTQTIFLADMVGDGLTDLVRIRYDEICYWPNLGYGRFGAKVAMGNVPLFDSPDQFDPKRIHLADIDGTGNIDIIYIGREAISLYFNQSGNSWSAAQVLAHYPRTDSLKTISVADLLGNGTACLIWSSSLLSDARQPMRYIDLMGGQKPHLLIKTINNLGAETTVSYAPSTRFYLADKMAGQPWVTKLPFPVHCVEKVTVTDKWRQTSFSTTYSYHHGYYDGPEREFRGFGRVEQIDVEDYGTFASGNIASPYITQDKTLYQPPVKTVTWYHTGAMRDRERILSQFSHEYFPSWLAASDPNGANALGGFQENELPEPDLANTNLTVQEWREALRACKGMMLRQEIYELDVDALASGEQRPMKLFSTTYHNCHIHLLQAQSGNLHAVFLVTESEAITYQYELDLTSVALNPDPRIAHTLNLRIDEYGNILQSVAAVYPRRGQFMDDTLRSEELALIHNMQEEAHLAYTETRYTNDIDEPDIHRLHVPCETLAYELSAISPADPNGYFTLAELRQFRLSPDEYQTQPDPLLIPVPSIPYHQLAQGNVPEKRLVEHGRMLFFKDDAGVLQDPLPLRQLGRLGLLYETYKLALTDALLNAIFTDASGNKLDAVTPTGLTARASLADPNQSGYLSGTLLASLFTGLDTTGQYWIRSGIAGFAPDAAQHFYLPERYIDPFGNFTTAAYDPAYHLFVQSTTDALGNTSRITGFDYRVLAPREMQDINDNFSEAFFDILGLPAAMAVKGKGNEGDNLSVFDDTLANPDRAALAAFFGAQAFDENPTRQWLGTATARHVYYFGEMQNQDGSITWGAHPACACGILRETHVSELAAGEESRLQTAFEYTDGMGSVVVKKVQAEPETAGGPLRWVASGKTILSNKGKPVKQYEPYFSSSGHRFEEPKEEGVTHVVYYDAAGRTVRTEAPDGTFDRVEFTPWEATTYDVNDTVKDSQWFVERGSPDPAQPLPFNASPETRAAWLAAQHADTPATTVLDSLGRNVVSIAHNRVKDQNGIFKDEKYFTFTKLDAEGKPLWIRDARKNLVMQYIVPPVPNGQPSDPMAGFAPSYDIAGNLLFQHSMDAGDRWTLNDAAGKPMRGWNSRGYAFRVEYDALHRPFRSFVQGANPMDPARELLMERTVYGEGHPDSLSVGANAAPGLLNLRGKPFLHFDQAGMVKNAGHDFKGNLLRGSRRIAREYKKTGDWSPLESVPGLGSAGAMPTPAGIPPPMVDLSALDQALVPLLEDETFTSATIFDALNRPIQLVAPHSDRPGTKFNVIRPGYNEANLLERVDVWLNQTAEPFTLLAPNTATPFVTNIDYDAKGQRQWIVYGNGVITRYEYDPFTFRLTQLLTDRGAGFPADWPQPPVPPGVARGGIQNLSYVYDPTGNITNIRDDSQQTIYFNGARVEPSSDYEYDALYRLTAAAGREHLGQTNNVPNPPRRLNHDDSFRMNLPHPGDSQAMGNYLQSYVYDPVGNILAMRHRGSNPAQSGWKRCFQYAFDSNRLLSTGTPSDLLNPDSPCPTQYAATPVYSEVYAYDAHGSMTKMPHLPQLDWDSKDQLQHVDLGGGGQAYYVYDSNGQRVRKVREKSPGLVEERIYLGGFEVFRQKDSSGDISLERETLHVMDDKQHITIVETKTIDMQQPGINLQPLIRYQFSNHLGSASLELDNHGAVISYEEYYPYGSTSYQAGRNVAEVSLKRYRYTGMERDEETGFNYHGARYYAPWLARWTASDPGGMVDGGNLYRYSRNSPVILSDPNGMDPPEKDEVCQSPLTRDEQEQEDKAGMLEGKQSIPYVSSDEASRQFWNNTVIPQLESGKVISPPPPQGSNQELREKYTLMTDSEKEKFAIEEWGIEIGPNISRPMPKGFDPVKERIDRWDLDEAENAGVLQGFEIAALVSSTFTLSRSALSKLSLHAEGELVSRGFLEAGAAPVTYSEVLGPWKFQPVPGMTFGAATTVEEEAMARSVAPIGYEHGIINDEEIFFNPEKRTDISIIPDPSIHTFSHTHWGSEVGLPSVNDVIAAQNFQWAPDTVHRVVGFKWPNANMVIRSLPELGQLPTTDLWVSEFTTAQARSIQLLKGVALPVF